MELVSRLRLCRTYQRTVKVFHGYGRVWILFTRGVGGGQARHGCPQTHHASAEPGVAGTQGGQVGGVEAGELRPGAGMTGSGDLGEAGVQPRGLGGQGQPGGRQPRGQRRGHGGRLLGADGRHVGPRHRDVGRRGGGARRELKEKERVLEEDSNWSGIW